jgi:chromosome partitioning protein
MNKVPYIIVLGNEKGGSGKTTTSMHLIFSLISKGLNVGCLDLDLRQLSLNRYLENRVIHNKDKIDSGILSMPSIIKLDEDFIRIDDVYELEEYYKSIFFNRGFDFIVIDTPGNNTLGATIAHSFADLIITPINDSLIDLDLIAKIDTVNLKEMKPSIYSAMIWEQKIRRFKRDSRKINWMIIRNRLSNLDSNNRRFIEKCLKHLSRNLSFKYSNGFSERLIYRELFPSGLTLIDIFDGQDIIKVTPSHIAARQELRNFLNDLKIPIFESDKELWLNQNYDLYKEIENSNAIINLTDKILN